MTLRCLLIISLTFGYSACKKRKDGSIHNNHGAGINHLPGDWESPCYLSSENTFITFSKTVRMHFEQNSIVRTETLWLDTACQNKLLSRVLSVSYQIMDNVDRKRI